MKTNELSDKMKDITIENYCRPYLMIQLMMKELPNDMDLGRIVRKYMTEHAESMEMPKPRFTDDYIQ